MSKNTEPLQVSLTILEKSKINLPYKLAMPLLGYIPEINGSIRDND